MPFYLTYINDNDTVTNDATPYESVADAVRRVRSLPSGWVKDAWIENHTGKQVADKAAIDAFRSA